MKQIDFVGEIVVVRPLDQLEAGEKIARLLIDMIDYYAKKGYPPEEAQMSRADVEALSAFVYCRHYGREWDEVTLVTEFCGVPIVAPEADLSGL